jgi:hypothetical protein
LPIYRLAKEYSQSPDDVEKWKAKTFDEAWDIYIAENRETWPLETEAVKRNGGNMKNLFVLDMDFNFWKRFIKDGKFDKEAVKAAGYTDEQLPDIEKQIIEAGWLEYEGEPKEEEKPSAKPHTYQEANGWCAVCGKSEGYKSHMEKKEEVTASLPVPSSNNQKRKPRASE